MEKLLKIGGRERPVRFSTSAKAEFARHNNVSYGEVEGGFQFDLMSACLLIYYGLKHGARRSPSYPLPKGFSWEMVADWIDDFPDEKAIENGMMLFAESMGVGLEPEVEVIEDSPSGEQEVDGKKS